MTAIAPWLGAFLREHLPGERRASSHTCAAYADAFQLLLCFAARKLETAPSSIKLEQLEAPLVLAFLQYLEEERGNCVKTRNARLAAINAFFRFLEYRLPSCIDQARRIHALPVKKTDDRLIDYLTHEEVQVLLDAPDATTVSGVRDQAMLHLAFAAGLRVSELVGLELQDLRIRPYPQIHVQGKGRRERLLPLWKVTMTSLRRWLAVRLDGHATALFLNAGGEAMTRSGFRYILAKHVANAARHHPSLADKSISPHVLRHSCAMHTLHATHDVRKVSLWLGHASLQSTEVYLRCEPNEKLEALAMGLPPGLQRGRYEAPDKVLALLQDIRAGSRYAQ